MDPMLPQPYTVRMRREDTADTFTLDLAPAEPGQPVPPFAPGQFNMLLVHGVGEVPISICGAAEGTPGFAHTTRHVGTVTGALARLAPGDGLGLRGPYGRGWPVDAAEGGDLVVVAGGIGLAPLRPGLEHVAARRERFGRVALVYGARTPADLLYRADLDRWALTHDIEVIVTVDRAAGTWHGRIGVVTSFLRGVAFDPTRTSAWLCGPELMMRYAAAALEERAVPPNRIHVSLERNMKCAIGHCGHCQLGPDFLCREGPVLPWSHVSRRIAIPEL